MPVLGTSDLFSSRPGCDLLVICSEPNGRTLTLYLENHFVSIMSGPPIVVVAGVGNATGTGAAVA